MNRISKATLEKIKRAAAKKFRAKFDRIAESKLRKVKKQLISEFLAHPVTVEIQNGPSSSNISGTLSGVSNLFGFIGFEAGSKPIDPILDILEDQIRVNFWKKNGSSRIYKIEFPTSDDIFKATPMPWAEGRSWAQGIELGISGLGYLIEGRKSGRSGVAIQSKKKKVRSARFRNTKYISSMLNKYKKEFKTISI